MRTLPLLSMMAGVLLAGTFNSGCGHQADKAELAPIDSLIRKVDSMQSVWNAIDIARYQGYAEAFASRKEQLELHFVDTLDRDRAFLLGNYYRAMGRSLQKMLNNHGRTGTELSLAAKQLADLRHDVEHGLLKETERTAFLEQERMMVKELERYMGTVRSAEERITHVWETDHHRVDSILNALKGS